jgi:molecular chaperone GrpE
MQRMKQGVKRDHDERQEGERELDAAVEGGVSHGTAEDRPDTAQQEVSLEELDAAAGEKASEGAGERVEEQTPEQRAEELKRQLETANDKYLRLMAEFDNYKRRTGREYERLVEYASEQLMSQIIEVLENFERALDPKHCNGDSAKFAEGVKLIYTKLDGILRRNGLEPFGKPGEQFDPERHDALMKTPHEEIPQDHIAQVFERGYKLKEKIIRHAKVIVSAGKSPPQEQREEQRQECEKKE